MGSDIGKTIITKLLKSLKSICPPAQYKDFEGNLLAWEDSWGTKYEKVKLQVEELMTADNVDNLTTMNILRDQATRLKNQNTELTHQKKSLEDENALLRSSYDELEKRTFQVEEAIRKLKDHGVNSAVWQEVPCKQKLMSPVNWERFIYKPQGGASKSNRAAKSSGKGSILDITESDDDSIMLVDPSEKESGSRKINGSNIRPQTHGEERTEGLSWDRASFVDLSDDRIENPRRKLRKLGTCSVVREANRSSLKSVVDTVDLDNFQVNSVMGTNSFGKGAATSANTKEGDSCSPLKRRQFMEDEKWKYDADMLTDFSRDDGLCMSAVCALYRHQKSEGSSSKVFSLQRGSSLIKYLTNGDPQGRLGRSISEVQKFNSSFIRDCRSIAVNYFKELFQIYEKKEDPFFPHA